MKNLAYIVLFLAQGMLAQVNYLLPNEQLIFSFETTKRTSILFDRHVVFWKTKSSPAGGQTESIYVLELCEVN